MKVVIPNFAAPDSFVDNVAFTLRSLGHEVLTRPAKSNRWVNSRVNRLRRQVKQHYFPRTFSDAEKWLLKAVRDFKPELILTLTQPIAEEVLFETRKRGVPHRIVWWGDTPANMKHQGILSTEWDFIYIKDSLAVQKFKRLGLNAELMHEAMNPKWHFPIAKQSNNRLVVAGTFYGYRHALVERLLNRGLEFDFYGAAVPRWCSHRIKELHTGTFVVREEKSRVFGEGLGVLNSTALSEGNSMNCRAFEIAGAGGLQFLEYRDVAEECFEPGKELLMFDTMDELVELVHRANRDQKWATDIREAGALRAKAEHTYEHRLSHILKRLEQ